jgi:large subunit ribosomal protein L29
MAEAYTAKELRTKNPDQLKKILAERQERLRHVRFQVSSREIKNLRELRFLRREIARIHTVLTALAADGKKPPKTDQ